MLWTAFGDSSPLHTFHFWRFSPNLLFALWNAVLWASRSQVNFSADSSIKKNYLDACHPVPLHYSEPHQMALLAEDTAMLTKHHPGVGSSTELQDFSGLTNVSTWQGDHPLQGKKGELFVKNCAGHHISVASLMWAFCLWGTSWEAKGSARGLGAAHLRMDVLCSTSSWQSLWLAVWSTSRKYWGEASRKKANKRGVTLWWLLWAETSC